MTVNLNSRNSDVKILNLSESFKNDDFLSFNPHTPVAQKIADEVVFRRFQGEGVEFF